MSRHTLPALVAETPLQPQTPAPIVFGRDEGGKQRAGWFGASDVSAAAQAASLMKMRILQLDEEAHRAFVAELAPGRVFASGRAFTPTCARSSTPATSRSPAAAPGSALR